MAPPAIGLIGRARAGKDTAAAILAQHHGYERRAFADTLKATLTDADPFVRVTPDEHRDLEALGWPRVHEWHRDQFYRLSELVAALGMEATKNTVADARRLLQGLGVAVRDHLDPDAWIRPVIGAIQAREAPRIVVTDVRFPNEAAAIRAAGGVLVRIVRPSHHLPAAGLHVSETALDDFRVQGTVVNDGTLADLARLVDALIVAFDE